MKFFGEYGALMRKMFLLTKRKRTQTIIEFVLAYIFLALLLAMRFLLDLQYKGPLQMPTFRPYERMSSNSTRANLTFYWPSKFFLVLSCDSKSLPIVQITFVLKQLWTTRWINWRRMCPDFPVTVSERSSMLITNSSPLSFFSQRHTEYRFTNFAQCNSRIDLRLRNLHQCQCILYRCLVNARSSAIHDSNARVSIERSERKSFVIGCL